MLQLVLQHVIRTSYNQLEHLTTNKPVDKASRKPVLGCLTKFVPAIRARLRVGPEEDPELGIVLRLGKVADLGFKIGTRWNGNFGAKILEVKKIPKKRKFDTSSQSIKIYRG